MDIERIKKNVIVEDEQIILGDPLVITKYGRNFEINQIKWVKWEKFVYHLSSFLYQYYAVCGMSKLPDNLNDLREFRENVRATISNKVAFIHLIKMGQFNYMTRRFMKKNFTADDYIEIFMYIYTFNILGIKKSCTDALKVLKLKTE